MPVVILDESLTVNERYLQYYNRTVERITNRVIRPENAPRGRAENQKPAKEVVLRHTIPENSTLRHTSFLDYMTQCYAIHYGIEISPDTFWYQIITEIATQVKETPEPFRDLFTDSDEKKTILVETGDITALPLDKIIEELKKLVPTNADAFLPAFSTTSPECFFAYSAAFADLCSPYYNYITYMCGFPKMRIRGAREDYDKLEYHIKKLKSVFSGRPVIPNYLERVLVCVMAFRSAFEQGRLQHLSDILTTKSCGSGGEIQCDGWWAKLMYIKDMSGNKPENFPSGISRVEYENLETKRKFSVNVGLLHSTVDEEGIAIPDWSFVVTEIVA